MRGLPTHFDGDGRRSGGTVSLSVALLALWMSAPLQARITGLETSTDALRNGRELQEQIAALSASVTPRSPMFVRGDVLFAAGTAELDAVSRADLQELADFLIEYPSHIAIIEGHTDGTGTDDDNQVLSQRRADAVKSYLVDCGVDPKRLLAFGRGEGLPIADNRSEQGREQNRRAAVTVRSQSHPPAGAAPGP